MFPFLFFSNFLSAPLKKKKKNTIFFSSLSHLDEDTSLERGEGGKGDRQIRPNMQSEFQSVEIF